MLRLSISLVVLSLILLVATLAVAAEPNWLLYQMRGDGQWIIVGGFHEESACGAQAKIIAARDKTYVGCAPSAASEGVTLTESTPAASVGVTGASSVINRDTSPSASVPKCSDNPGRKSRCSIK